MASVRRLTAILAADVAGYSRLMGADEEVPGRSGRCCASTPLGSPATAATGIICSSSAAWSRRGSSAYRVEPEPLWDALLDDHQQLSHPLFRVRRVDEVEVAAFSRGEIGHQAVVYPVRIDDDSCRE
jgi:hypothetical protein